MTTLVRRRLRVGGVVQGVGFRPFVHRLAGDERLAGSVRNDGTGVTIEVEGPTAAVDRFTARLRTEAPPLASIDRLEATDEPAAGTAPGGFRIEPTPGDAGRVVPSVPPDTAVCDDCVAELLDPTDRRHRHPFVTCTNCGPRFTIITALPYDRPATTMAGFPLCPSCGAEYHDPADRRHHAQPIACPDCGPTLRHEAGTATTTGTDAALAAALDQLAAGRIVAVKSVGGYHLACDATDDAAVRRLRERKHRPDKPLAVMVPDLEGARVLGEVDDAAAAALTAPARPVVLLPARPDTSLAPAVAPRNPLVGVMLPSAPLHHLLFRTVPGQSGPVPEVLVMTSANLAGQPICHDDADARTRLAGIADTVLAHDRAIRVPCDDSVVRLVAGAELPIRRSRGHAPLPVRLPFAVAPTLALGGDLKNVVGLAEGDEARLSQHLGDLADVATLEALTDTIERLSALYGIEPERIVADRHPDYHSRRVAHAVAGDRPVVEVGHHHAHLAALMAEHGLAADATVLGVVFDGTGYGDDGTLWGGELLAGGYGAVDRVGHLAPVGLPGGEAAVRHPWRAAVAHLTAAGVVPTGLPPGTTAAAPATERALVDRQLERDVACPPSTSMGRLFDATASLLGVRHHISYEAQAAIELEHLATTAGTGVPHLAFGFDGPTIDPAPVVRGLAAGLRAGTGRAELALAFHRAVADAVTAAAVRVRDERGITTVGLTGGVFQNALLTRLTADRLGGEGLDVLTHRLVPANDGGLALGQVAVAAAREVD